MSFDPDPRQQEAIEHVHGPMLVLAGAGTGKTTVLVRRIARLIETGAARPNEILAVTYTDNAAAELRERIAGLVSPEAASAIHAGTFHASCFRVLEQAGRAFGVLDKQDLYIYLRQRLPDLQLDRYTKAVNPAEFLDTLLDFFTRCQDELVTADDYQRYVESLGRFSELPRVLLSKQNALLSPDEVLVRCREIARVYRKVEEMLAADNLGTFGHMILHAVQVLRDDPRALARERARARFLLIDEFQDANLAQILLAELLGGEQRNVFAVGDPDQAIYRFRGATSAAFDEFVRRFPGTRGVVLNANRRSGENILACAHAAISANPDLGVALPGGVSFRRERLLSVREPGGALLPPAQIVVCSTGEAGNREEAADVVAAIDNLRAQPPSGSDKPRFGVLYRSHKNRDFLVEQLAAREVPFAVKGINALETAEVRNLLACLAALHNPADSEALFRVAALPLFGLDPPQVRDALAAVKRGTLFSVVLAEIPGGKQVAAAVERIRGMIVAAKWDIAAAARICLAEFALDASHPALRATTAFIARWKDKKMVREGTVAEFLAYMAYFPEAGGAVEVDTECSESDVETVQLMTAHAAKGLEFDHVFVLRVNSGSFPTSYREPLFEFPAALQKAAPQSDGKERNNEEERRLFYVALTRARDSLTVVARRGRGRNGDPTGFARDVMFYREPGQKKVPGFWVRRDPSVKMALQAAALQSVGVGEWLLAPASVRLQHPKLSASAVEAYETCPLKFKLRRDWQIPGPVSGGMQYGAIVHQVLKDYFDALRQERPRSREQVLALFRELLQATAFDDPHQRELFRKQGEQELSAFVAAQAQQSPPAVLDTERWFEINLDGITVTGRLDRIDRLEAPSLWERVAIVDYKTGSPKEQKDAERSLQLSLYAIAAQERWGWTPERLVLYNLADNSQVATTRDSAALEEARERVAAVAAGIAAGHFDAKPSFSCAWCEFRRLCPATEQRVYTIARAAGA